MDVKIQAAIIASSVSIFIAFISAYFSAKREREVLKRFESTQRRELALKIYDRRLACYAEAFQITERLDRHKGLSVEAIMAIQQEAKEKLQSWHGAEAALIMSSRSIEMYYQLRNYLGRQPGENGRYSDKQRENIINYRSAFRSSLRKDIGILHESADSEDP